MAEQPTPEQQRHRRRQMSFSRVQQECRQGHLTRVGLYRRLEELLGEKKKVVALFTSFFWPVVLQDGDADMLEEVLRNSLDDGDHLVLVLNCPGGDALAAERIINICRSYSANGFTVIVPKMAKSAATMVCLGATQIWMSETSELGPIDPQIRVQEPGQQPKYLAAHEILESYNELMDKANQTKGRVEPYLQQLSRFDARDMRWIVSAQQLSESIAVRSLRSGVMKGRSPAYVKRKIKPLLDPTYAKVHGRPLYPDAVEKCGLDVQLKELHSDVWQAVWDLYIRLDNLVGSSDLGVCKIVESLSDYYTLPIIMRES